MDLGEFNDIKTLPGFPRAAAATLQKAWAAGLKFTELAKTSDARPRYAAAPWPTIAPPRTGLPSCARATSTKSRPFTANADPISGIVTFAFTGGSKAPPFSQQILFR